MSNPIPANANQGCVGPTSSEAGKVTGCSGCPNQGACSTGAAKTLIEQGDPAIQEVKERLSSVRHKILVLSGKGGVGKSTVSSQLSWTLSDAGLNIGLLDVDICGPSAPRMLGVENHEVRKSSYGWSPVYASETLGVMSVGFMLNSKNDAIVWRGPRKNGLIKQFLTDVYWGELDVLFVDAPPGTSDEHLSITTYLKDSDVDGAIIVTTPQEISLLDVRKEISFCHKVGVKVLGVVENMAGFTCPCCRNTTEIFEPSTGGAIGMCAEMNVPYLGKVSLDPYLMRACEQGKSYISTFPDAPAVTDIKKLVATIFQTTPALAKTQEEYSVNATLEQLTSKDHTQQNGGNMQDE